MLNTTLKSLSAFFWSNKHSALRDGIVCLLVDKTDGHFLEKQKSVLTKISNIRAGIRVIVFLKTENQWLRVLILTAGELHLQWRKQVYN